MAGHFEHQFFCARCKRLLHLIAALMILGSLTPGAFAAEKRLGAPERIPPKRSSQIDKGLGGVNTSLPRDPYIPWNRWWWTRMFDGGISWARIGQYEDTSDISGWDWIEQKRGEFSSLPELDDYVDSLLDNGMKVQLQLLYGNPIYTSPAGKLPDSMAPTPASVHNRDLSLYSIFWPPKTPEQIAAFVRYTKWMVNHFRGRIHYYALWNEQDGSYWNPDSNAEEYGRLLGAFVKAVHETDPSAKLVYGGQASLSTDFARAALDACQCASSLDVFAYHTYPGGYSQNAPPESMDYGAFGPLTPTALRAAVRSYPGIRSDIQFWDDEFNILPDLPRGNDETVQAKYVTRGMLYNWSFGIPTSIWELINDTSTDEGDNFGLIHGMMFKPTDFTPRLVYAAVQNLDAVFSDTKRDNSIAISSPDFAGIQTDSGAPVLAYGFRSAKGKAVVGYWLAAHSWPHNVYLPQYVTLTLKNTGIEHPVLANVYTGEIKPLEWKAGTHETLERVPLLDSVQAIVDAEYFDWPVLPEAPSSLEAKIASGSALLTWEPHGGDTTAMAVERRVGDHGSWERVAKLPAGAKEYTDSRLAKGQGLSYRVRALNDAGESAYSNIVRVTI
ncbi:MAG: hypothetical protein ACLQVL_24350 [Terriglobia bacterium]